MEGDIRNNRLVPPSIRSAAILLRTSDRVVATAASVWHSFHQHSAGGSEVDENDLLAACLLLAAKVEEEPRRIRDVINAVLFVMCREKLHDAHRYWGKKERILRLEQDLLRALAFDTFVEQPLLFLLNYLYALRAPHSLCELSVALVNDGVLSAGCARCPARVIASAAIALAASMLVHPLPAQWWVAFDVDWSALETAAHAILDVFEHGTGSLGPESACATAVITSGQRKTSSNLLHPAP
jgi:cyclin L